MRTAITVLAALLVASAAIADISPWMSYQGVLRDASGNAIPDGSYVVEFNLYDVEAGGTSLWTETQTLTATGGIVNAYLGSVVPLNTLDFDVPYWLGISIEGEPELSPRTPLTTVPYAGHAGYADTVLEPDQDWTVDGDDVYHDVGNVGVGTSAIDARLDVLAEPGGIAGDFVGASTGTAFILRTVNNTGTAGAFFSNEIPTSYPAIPAAVYGKGGPGSRGGHFHSSGSDAIFAYSSGGRGIWASSPVSYAGYFGGGGLGVLIEDQLETGGFRMQTGAEDGYVLTSDVDGIGTWQPASGGADGDWTISGSDMYSAVSGNVGVGTTAPAAKLGVYGDTSDEVFEVMHGINTAGRTVNIERTLTPTAGNDVLQLKVPGGSGIGFQFLECEQGTSVKLAIDGDGYIDSASGAEFDDLVYAANGVDVTGMLDVSANSNPAGEFTSNALDGTHPVLNVVSTASGVSNVIGVYGESVPSDGWGVGGKFVGGQNGVVGTVAATGSDQYIGVGGQATGGTGANYGLKGYAAYGALNYGVYASVLEVTGTNYAGWFSGDVHISGTMTAGSKAFKIDHPLDPENKYLTHSCVESDDMMNIYNGNVELDDNGSAWVVMPDWFGALNADFRYQLTCIGGFAPVYVATEISDGRFRIAGGEPGMKVSWQVTGVRHDPVAEMSRLPVEQEKPADEAGRYLFPRAYGRPASEAIGYLDETETQAGTELTEPARRPVLDRGDNG